MNSLKKKLLTGALAFSMLASAGAAIVTHVSYNNTPITITASADTEQSWGSSEVGGNLTAIYNNGTLTISGSGEMINTWAGYWEVPWNTYNNNITKVVIGSEVQSIGARAFINCGNLTQVEFEGSENLTTIGNYAFMNCGKLPTITIPDSVTMIGESAFYNCNKLENVTLSNKLTVISKEAFSYCESLESITIPASVTSVGYYAFNATIKLSTVEFLGSNCNVDEDAFMGVAWYSPERATLILPIDWNKNDLPSDNSWHKGKFDLFEHEYDVSATAEDNVIAKLDRNTGTLTVSGTGDVKTMAFVGTVLENHKSEVKKVVVEKGVKSIGPEMFKEFDSLTSVTFAESIEYVNAYAFYGCTKLESVEFKGTDCYFGVFAFGNVGTAESPAKLILPKNWVGETPNEYGAFYDGTFTQTTASDFDFCTVIVNVFKGFVMSILALLTYWYWVGKIFVPGN